MATYDQLKKFIRTIKPATEMQVGNTIMKGERLKAFLVSKLSRPNLIDLTTEVQEPKKTKTKAKEEPIIQQTIKTE